MNAFLWTLLQLMGLAVLMAVAVLGAWAVIRLAPMTKARRRSLEQWFPILQLGAVLSFLVLGAQGLFSDPTYRAVSALLTLVFGLWLARSTWLDLWHGAFLRASGHVKVDDHVAVGPWEGRVQRLGPRVLTLETADGTDAIVPYSRLANRTIVRRPRIDGAHRYAFEVAVPDASWTSERLRHLALMHHWSTPSKPPHVESAAPDRFVVTVFALMPQHAAEIERDVVRAVERASA